MINTINEIKTIKNGKKITNEELSVLSGVPLGTINKILSGATKSVKAQTLDSLRLALDSAPCKACVNNYGFYKVGAFTPNIILASPKTNADIFVNAIVEAGKKGVSLIAFPKLSLTGATLGNLYFQQSLLEDAKNALQYIAEQTKNVQTVAVIGLPMQINCKIYSVGAVVYGGKILGIVPENYADNRYFASFSGFETIDLFCNKIPFGNILFKAENHQEFTFNVDFSTSLTKFTKNSGANLTVILSSLAETVNKTDRLKSLVSSYTFANNCALVLAESGYGESTTDSVFAGVNLISENGNFLSESKPFSSGLIYNDVDFEFLNLEKCKNKSCELLGENEVIFNLKLNSFSLTRSFEKMPFVPKSNSKLQERAELILNIQANALKRRIQHTRAKALIIGVSGGLDSTLALLVAVRALNLLNRKPSDIIAITMPCFGTTIRTKNNAYDLSNALGCTLKEISVKDAVTIHFKDIEHNPSIHDVTFENSQARERTQVLMDYANKMGGLVVGTGDLSELALGWATYNGDHMSNYGVNASIPKTLIRYLVKYEADKGSKLLKNTLLDILDTPVSPELIPAVDGEISQKTEDLVGPYILHDFFLYYAIRRGYSPSKIYYIATNTFKKEYSNQTIYKWIENFYRRFFAQQFKRSCLPDGVKVGSVSLSPRGDFSMPSDAYSNDWLSELETVKGI